jgi:microcystin-dependent protein
MSYLGEIKLFAGTFAPLGWLFCDGGLLPISENDALYALIGTTYGGDGQSTFGLPDLRGRVPIHQGTNPQTGSTFTLAEMAGVESVTLTPNTIPQHTHAFNGAGTDGNQQSPAGRLPATSPTIKPYRNAGPSTAMKPFVGLAGGSQPHENLQPYLGINFIISQFGEFPQQS